LKGIHKHTVEKPESDRICPRCDKPLQTINLKVGEKFLVERCTECLGLFFDPGELEALLDKSVSNVFYINYNQLENIKKVRRHQDYPVGYIKCPVCRKLMNRINFGSRSGVIVDKCRDHGIWVDGGELRQLMEWIKAGGQLLHHQVQREANRIDQQAEKRKKRQMAIPTSGNIPYNDSPTSGYDRGGFGDGEELFGLLTRTVSRLFRL
jgi:Zn-finger nucleic acid-binding protein